MKKALNAMSNEELMVLVGSLEAQLKAQTVDIESVMKLQEEVKFLREALMKAISRPIITYER